MPSATVLDICLDGFCDPLPKTAYNHIYKGWALQNGGAEIVVAKADPELTRMVLKEVLARDLEYQYYLHGWQSAVDDIATEALGLYIGRVRKPETEEKEIEALMHLIWELASQTIPQERWINIASDTSLPVHIRLVANARCPSFEQSEAWKMVNEIISPYFSGELNELLKVHFVLKFFWHLENAGKHFQTLMLEPNAPLESIKYLIDSLVRSDLTKETKIELLSETVELNNLHNERRFFLMLMLAVMGCEAAAVNLTKTLKENTIEHLSNWAFHLGHFSQEHAMEGLKVLDSMTLKPLQFQQIVSQLSAGLNYIIDPTVSLSGVLDKQYRHPATPAFTSWVSSGLENFELGPQDRLHLLDSASQIGCQQLAEHVPILMEEVLGLLPKSPIDSEMFDAGQALCSGMRLCEREHRPLSNDILLRIIESTTYNAAQEALNLLLKQCDERIIPRLIDIYADPKSDSMKEPIFSVLERLASRYGKRIIREGVQMKAVEW